jgi:hypothetical protein
MKEDDQRKEIRKTDPAEKICESVDKTLVLKAAIYTKRSWWWWWWKKHLSRLKMLFDSFLCFH